jgi:hypothetical protein
MKSLTFDRPAISYSGGERGVYGENGVNMQIIRKNKLIILILGLISIVVGYIFLAQDSISLAPALLVLGYCILIPLALL